MASLFLIHHRHLPLSLSPPSPPSRPWVERKVADLPRFNAVLKGVAARGAYVVFLLRLSPLVPFNLLNYALGLTAVPLLPYVASSWLGMLPGTFAYVYLGGAGRAAVSAAAGGGGAVDTTQLVLYGVGAVATILATRAISIAATKALQEEQEGKGEERAAGDDNADFRR
ncbi:hypothetical protein VOLCADRAFT_94530 [Volvox carteri f. nagariensis]|uniref:VTT domain-containing protein n=1 Tax=Volvox carteri f. nagariensis TaxID=3068 RepID=D8U513_VOLCA|nr:uncharacterized protein VOLCADRAFT_94530 [Volvox carteri f. nagariensis]EFJ45137.1 hypothetical protein VOLCADRAFT_94530 [Volvox carteri f. nagariensis]|eukprot:XP_002953813.1 hypothetical protein VOLCADRAFT_94530 [Volvox carteri f. nagariensis]